MCQETGLGRAMVRAEVFFAAKPQEEHNSALQRRSGARIEGAGKALMACGLGLMQGLARSASRNAEELISFSFTVADILCILSSCVSPSC